MDMTPVVVDTASPLRLSGDAARVFSGARTNHCHSPVKLTTRIRLALYNILQMRYMYTHYNTRRRLHSSRSVTL